MIPFVDLVPQHAPIRAALDAAYARVMARSSYILGEELAAFEQAYAQWCGVRHCIGVGNGLDALTLILRALDVGPDDEVIVPSNTFIATWLAVSQAGAMPRPVEPDPRTFNLDPLRVEEAITPRTRAIIAVHLYGRLADMHALREIADRHDVALIEDAAQAHGASRGGVRAGALGHAAAFSFYPTKNLGALGDAGAVTTDDDRIAARVRLLRNYGSPRKYEHAIAGVNSRLDELQAAFLATKLAQVDRWNADRRTIARRYRTELSGLIDVQLPQDDGDAHVWHLFVLRCRDRDALAAFLQSAGVATQVHYPVPPHRSGAYRDRSWPPLPEAETLAHEVLSLPLYPGMTDEQVTRVIDAVAAFPHR
jgi:dTDP-4-amino-4,6-dideoxygalactose transaminase